jgi:hypothetical protein
VTLYRKRTGAFNWLGFTRIVPVVAATSGALQPKTLRLLYDFARLKTDAGEQHAVANSLRSPLTPERLCQRRGTTFARLRMEAQLYSLRVSATRITGKHWAAPYASSPLPRSRARARYGVGAFVSRPISGVGLGLLLCGFLAAVSRALLSHCFSLCDLRLFVNKWMLPHYLTH